MIFLAFYTPDDYLKLLRVADDRDTLFKSWTEWKSEVDKVKLYLESNHLECTILEISVSDILDYCLKNNLPNTGSTRSKYVTELGMGKDSGE